MTCKVAIDLALGRLFTYEVPPALQEKLAVGQLLSVPFAHQEKRGFCLAISEAEPGCEAKPRPLDVPPHYTLKPISAIVDEIPFFSAKLLELVKKIAAYTASPLESVLRAAVPAAVVKKGARAKEQLYVAPALVPEGLDVRITRRQQWLYEQVIRLGGGWLQSLAQELGTTPATLRQLAALGLVTVLPRQRFRSPLLRQHVLPTKPLPLNPDQQAALAAILDLQPSTTNLQPVLLHGITGSGKTEVYLQAIAQILAAGQSAIVMVPEIALTPQTVQRFASRFGDQVAVLHSALSDGERYDEWHRIRSGAARVVIGPRSAVFAPVQKLGLIVVDEEHEMSYKQEDPPRYQARDAAVLRARIEGARVVLGSATPSLESYLNAQTGKYRYVALAKRAGAGTLPVIRLVNMDETVDAASAASPHQGMIYSPELLDAIKLRLDRHEQTILFLNRRGYSRSVTCESCGATVDCPRCELPYTYHQHDNCLRCHVCGDWTAVPRRCPSCGSDRLTYRGIGTQRAEAALQKCFKEARIIRMDADSTSRKDSHDDLLGRFRRHEADILLGTQMIAKGLDFPNVTLVGVLNADSSLNMPDIRAAERTYQLLAQVAGRAGRAELPGEVYIQTRLPDHPAIQCVLDNDYARFAAQELADRRAAALPPYTHLSLLRLRSEDAALVAAWADMYAKSLAAVPQLTVSEAMPSALEKADGWYRWQIVLSSETISPTLSAYRWITAERKPPAALRVTLDVDAYDMM